MSGIQLTHVTVSCGPRATHKYLVLHGLSFPRQSHITKGRDEQKKISLKFFLQLQCRSYFGVNSMCLTNVIIRRTYQGWSEHR